MPLSPTTRCTIPASRQTNFMVVTRATGQPAAGRRTRPPRSSTRARPTPRTRRTRCSCGEYPRTPTASRSATADAAGTMADGTRDGMATWAAVKDAGRTLLGHRARRPGRAQRAAAGHRPVRQVHARRQRVPAAGAPGQRAASRATPTRRWTPRCAVQDRARVPRRHRPHAVPHQPRQARPLTARTPTPDTGNDTVPPAPTTTSCSTRTSSPATAGSTRTSASPRSTTSSTPSTTAWRRTRRRSTSRRPAGHQGRAAPRTRPACRLADLTRCLERRAALPGRPLRHRDGVPAPRVRGVRPQGAADGQPLRRGGTGYNTIHRPGDQGRVRPRGLPLRALDADRDRGAPTRRTARPTT